MLESLAAPSVQESDVPSLNTSFSPAHTVHIEVNAAGTIHLASAQDFFELARGIPIEISYVDNLPTPTTQSFTGPEQAFAFRIDIESSPPAPAELSPNVPSPAGTLGLAAMAALIVWRRIESRWQRR